MLIVAGGNCGELWGVISLISLSERDVAKFGRAETQHEDCGGAQTGDNAYRSYVKPGAEPIFIVKLLRGVARMRGSPPRDSAQARRVESEALKQAGPESDEIEYVRLR
jgi:hypothetical protein